MVPADGGADSDILGRGWTPSPETRGVSYVLVGMLVVLNPLIGGIPGALGLTGTAEYAAAELDPEGDELGLSWVGEREESVVIRLASSGGLGPVDCYPPVVDSRACALEGAVAERLAERPATVDREPVGWRGYTYHDRFYERTVTGSGRAGLALRPVPAEAVLSNVSVPAERWPDPVRRAVETGSVTASEPPRLAGAVLERDGRYYVVVPTESEPRDEPPGTAFTAASTAAGVLLIRRGWRVGG